MESAQTYNELLNININIIKDGSKLSDADEYEDPRYYLVKKGLIEINKLGLLTDNGQAPYNYNQTPQIKTRQKGWVAGFYPILKITSFLEELDKNANIEYFVVMPNGEVTTNIKNWKNEEHHYFNCLTEDNYECRSRLHFDDYHGELEQYPKGLLRNHVHIYIILKKFCKPNINDVFCSFKYIYNEIIRCLRNTNKKFGKRFSFGKSKKISFEGLKKDLSYLKSI